MRRYEKMSVPSIYYSYTIHDSFCVASSPALLYSKTAVAVFAFQTHDAFWWQSVRSHSSCLWHLQPTLPHCHVDGLSGSCHSTTLQKHIELDRSFLAMQGVTVPLDVVNLYIPLSSERIATISSVSLDEIMPQGAAWGHQTACVWPAATRPLHRLDTFWNFKAIQGHLAAFYRTYISYKICEAGSCFRLAQVGASQVWVSGQSNRDPRVPWKQWLLWPTACLQG